MSGLGPRIASRPVALSQLLGQMLEIIASFTRVEAVPAVWAVVGTGAMGRLGEEVVQGAHAMVKSVGKNRFPLLVPAARAALRHPGWGQLRDQLEAMRALGGNAGRRFRQDVVPSRRHAQYILALTGQRQEQPVTPEDEANTLAEALAHVERSQQVMGRFAATLRELSTAVGHEDDEAAANPLAVVNRVLSALAAQADALGIKLRWAGVRAGPTPRTSTEGG